MPLQFAREPTPADDELVHQRDPPSAAVGSSVWLGAIAVVGYSDVPYGSIAVLVR